MLVGLSGERLRVRAEHARFPNRWLAPEWSPAESPPGPRLHQKRCRFENELESNRVPVDRQPPLNPTIASAHRSSAARSSQRRVRLARSSERFRDRRQLLAPRKRWPKQCSECGPKDPAPRKHQTVASNLLPHVPKKCWTESFSTTSGKQQWMGWL